MIVVANADPVNLENVEPREPIVFDVLSSEDLLRVVVCVEYPEAPTELAHDGDNFHPPYEGTRSAVTGGFRYVLRSTGGWRNSPSPTIFAVDVLGREL